MSEITATQFLSGSDKINLMRNNIDRVVNGVLGFVTKEEILGKHIPLAFSKDESHSIGIWELGRGFRHGQLIVWTSFDEGSTIHYASSFGATRIQREYVASVHRAVMNDFIPAMIQIFPALRDRLQTFRDAAESL